MTYVKTTYNRRSFLKVSAGAGGGFVLGFSWLAGCAPADTTATAEPLREPPKEWFDINGYLSIADNGQVTIMSPNPEIGQNVKTAMPMIVAEELDVAWKDVIVKQAPLNTDAFTRQVAGGSQSIRQGWQGLRMAGATARYMLLLAAAERWGIDVDQCRTEDGIIHNGAGASLAYAEVASAAALLEVPEEIELKDPTTFRIIGQDKPNVDIDPIITGQPLFGVDQRKENMVFAAALRPPAFGQELSSFDADAARQVTGVLDVIRFSDKIAVIATSTWAAFKGTKALQAEWRAGTKLESTAEHDAQLLALLDQPTEEPKRADGDARRALRDADQVIERTYEAPFLPHNCMEPMNFFADVTAERVYLSGPIQTPEWTRRRVAELLEREESEVHIDMTRMGGGFGRRLYGDFVLEAAEISSLAERPVQLVFSREDDMTAGTYRPASKYKFRAAIKDGEMVGYHLTGAGINMNNSTREHNFPACAVDHYLIESHNLESNITTGAWRAPVANFLAFAEQAFLDEVALSLEQDPVDFRLALLQRAKENPVGELQYDVDKMIGVTRLAAEKSGWRNMTGNVHKGFSVYYSHNSYVAEVAEVVMDGGTPRVQKVTCAVDCGIVINPLSALNQIEGGIIDGIGHAMYGDFSFAEGQPVHNNFDTYRLIRLPEAPAVATHFVVSNNDPTGLGEPTLPPAGGAVANAIFRATGERLYKQPFVNEKALLG